MNPLAELPPLEPQTDAPAPKVVDGDLVDDEADAFSTPREVLREERDKAMRAEYHWQVWDIEHQRWQSRRLMISCDRWTWWKIMRTHQAPINLDDDREIDLDTYAPQAWALLWLALHDPDEILNLVIAPKAFWITVNQWAEIHCSVAKWHEAIALMNTIRNNIAVLLTVPLPTRGSRRLGE